MATLTHRQKLQASRARLKKAWAYRLVLQVLGRGSGSGPRWIDDRTLLPAFGTETESLSHIERFAAACLPGRLPGTYQITIQTRRGSTVQAFPVPNDEDRCGTGGLHIHPLGTRCSELAPVVCAGCDQGLPMNGGVHFTPGRAELVC
jgi:hypothetical protein